MERLQLKCVDCGGIMEVDPNRKILSCPYCGSRQLMVDSDEVQIARINAEVEKVKSNNSVKQGFFNAIGGKNKVKEKEYEYKIEKARKSPLLNGDQLVTIISFLVLFVMWLIMWFS